MSRRRLVSLFVWMMLPLWVATVAAAVAQSQGNWRRLLGIRTATGAGAWMTPDTAHAVRLACVVAGTILAAIASGLVIAHAWARRRQPALPSQPREWVVCVAAAGCAASAGAFAGSLHDVEIRLHLSTAAAYFAFVPLALLALAITRPFWRAALRIVVFAVALDIGVNVAYGFSQRGHFMWWEDIWMFDVAFGLAALVVARFAAGARRIWPPRSALDSADPLAPRRPE